MDLDFADAWRRLREGDYTVSMVGFGVDDDDALVIGFILASNSQTRAVLCAFLAMLPIQWPRTDSIGFIPLLRLGNNAIGDEGALAIAAALKISSHLHQLRFVLSRPPSYPSKWRVASMCFRFDARLWLSDGLRLAQPRPQRYR